MYLCACVCAYMYAYVRYLCVYLWLESLGTLWEFDLSVFSVYSDRILIIVTFLFASWALEILWPSLPCSLWFYGLDLAEIERLDSNYEAEDVLEAR